MAADPHDELVAGFGFVAEVVEVVGEGVFIEAHQEIDVGGGIFVTDILD